METLEIKKKDAVKAHENAKNSGKKLLEDLFGKKTFLKDVTERIKTPGDAIAELGNDDPEVMSLLKLQSAGIDNHIYYNQLAVVIVKALNEGWVPDWSNSSQYKYYPWFRMGSPSGVGFSFYADDYWYSLSSCCSRLCFKSRELAVYAGKQFESIYKDFLTL